MMPWPSIIYIIEGAVTTLQYSITAVFFGLIIALILAIFKVSRSKLLQLFANIYTSVFRGTPLLVQLTIIYFALPELIGIKLTVFAAGILTFSLNSGAYVSEIIKAGINSVDIGQFEAAKALGIPSRLAMRDIILPQAMRNILPALVNELVTLVKESAIISIIGETDLMRRAGEVALQSYDYFTPMLTAAACYYILVLIISSSAKTLERRLAK